MHGLTFTYKYDLMRKRDELYYGNRAIQEVSDNSLNYKPLTGIILDDEEKGGGSSAGKPNGNCLASLVLMISIPAFLIGLFR